MQKKPPRIVRILIRVARLPVYGVGRSRFCPVCGRHSRRFAASGIVPRPEALCVWCFSLERHRLVWHWFEQRSDLFDGRPKSMLHVAPESCFEEKLRARVGAGYTTADLKHSPDVRMDVCHIPYPDRSFDVVYCSHVLEHVPDDRRAMREFYRVLKPSGWAVLLVPLYQPPTFEDPSVTDPDDRERLFGQHDHVRKYGPDYADRLREAGFDVTWESAAQVVGQDQVARLGLTSEEGGIFHCTKK
jgi:SAM-dependent methyltransferase